MLCPLVLQVMSHLIGDMSRDIGDDVTGYWRCRDNRKKRMSYCIGGVTGSRICRLLGARKAHLYRMSAFIGGITAGWDFSSRAVLDVCPSLLGVYRHWAGSLLFVYVPRYWGENRRLSCVRQKDFWSGSPEQKTAVSCFWGVHIGKCPMILGVKRQKQRICCLSVSSIIGGVLGSGSQ